MPDIICPICGTPNKPDAVICSMCHSRLTDPPGRTQSLESPPNEPPQEKEDLEWLERVRALNAMDQIARNGGVLPVSPEPATISVPETEPEVENPDWLYNTRDLNSAQKPPPPDTPGEDLSWLNDLRASTGSLGPPPENPTTAAQVLAAAAYAKHKERLEEEEKLGETQQLTPRSSIPGSASDWLDKLGAIPEEENVEPGFEESFGSPFEAPAPVQEYDIERATGSLGRSAAQADQRGETSPPPPPEVRSAAGAEVASPGQPPPPPNPVKTEGTPAQGGENLAFLDSLLTSITPPAATGNQIDTTPPIPVPPASAETIPPASAPAQAPAGEPSLSWLQDLQAEALQQPAPKPGPASDGTPDLTSEPPSAASSAPVFPVPPSPGEVAVKISGSKTGLPEIPSPAPAEFSPADFQAQFIQGLAAPAEIPAKPPASPSPEPSPELKNMPGFASTGLTGLLSGESLAGMGLEGVLPADEGGSAASVPSAAQPIAATIPAPSPSDPSQGMKDLPGFAPTGLTGFLDNDSLATMGMESVLPDGSRPAAPVGDSSPFPASPEIPATGVSAPPEISTPAIPVAPAPQVTSNPSPEMASVPLWEPGLTEEAEKLEPTAAESVDLSSLQPSSETPDWLKQYASDFVVDENQASIFPSQESLTQDSPAPAGFQEPNNSGADSSEPEESARLDLPEIPDFSPQTASIVQPAPAEIQDQDWLNTVMNETPSTPLDLFKDVEEPRFAAPAEESAPLPVQAEKPAAWVMEPGQHSGFTGPLPDWLQELEGEQPSKTTEQAAPEELVPDLFVSSPETPSAELRSAFPSVEPQRDDGLQGVQLPELGIEPEKLFGSAPATEAPVDQPPGVTLEDFGIQPQEILPDNPQKPTPVSPEPDWLSGLPSSPESPAPAKTAKEEEPAAKQPGGILPGLAADSVSTPPPIVQPSQSTTPAATGVPFGLESLPDWISAEGSDGEAGSPSGESAGLAQAEMPGWLEALKPVGMATAALAGAPKTPAASVSPATGALKPNTGSLPSKPGAPLPAAAPASPIPPGSETQKQYAAMMEQVLTRGPSPTSPAPREKKKRRRLIWILIGAAVLVLLLILAAVGLGFLPMPQLFSAETVTFYNTVETLPPAAPVLVALEYSPAFASELEPFSQTLINQLAARNARVTFVSTQPAGPILAENLIQYAAQRNAGNGETIVTENLGYLAGGSVGLQQFALRPTLAASNGWDGGAAWTTPALAGVTGLDQFAAVIVLSEDTGTSRDWIEQVQPRLGATPLLIATSAQTGPLLQPYISSSQVKGLVAGISGGAAYEKILGKPAKGSALWSLYLIGQVFALLVIFAGLILRVVKESRNSSRKER